MIGTSRVSNERKNAKNGGDGYNPVPLKLVLG